MHHEILSHPSVSRPDDSTLGPLGNGHAEALARDENDALARAAIYATLSLQLLRAGAPRSLVVDAHRASIDEVSRCHRINAWLAEQRGTHQAAPPSPFNRALGDELAPAEIAERAASLMVAHDDSARRLHARLRGAPTDVRRLLAMSARDDRNLSALSARIYLWGTVAMAPAA